MKTEVEVPIEVDLVGLEDFEASLRVKIRVVSMTVSVTRSFPTPAGFGKDGTVLVSRTVDAKEDTPWTFDESRAIGSYLAKECSKETLKNGFAAGLMSEGAFQAIGQTVAARCRVLMENAQRHV